MINHYLDGRAKYDKVILAFYEGCPEPKKLIENFKYEPGDVAVVFGVNKIQISDSWPRGQVIAQQRNENRDVVVLEGGYLNRGPEDTNHWAAGLNGLNGRANFRNAGMPGDRAKLLGIKLQPYKQGEDIILCGQVPWDASVDHTDHVAWLKECAAELQTYSKPVVFRPHPQAPLPNINGCKHSNKKLLAEDLENAWAAVTFNSNSGVEALVAGIPVFAFDEGSMVWSICNRSLSDIESPSMPDRTQWLNDLCYTQWTLPEMKEGLTWRHLFR